MKLMQRLSLELYLRRNFNKKVIRIKKSWDEINNCLKKKES